MGRDQVEFSIDHQGNMRRLPGRGNPQSRAITGADIVDLTEPVGAARARSRAARDRMSITHSRTSAQCGATDGELVEGAEAGNLTPIQLLYNLDENMIAGRCMPIFYEGITSDVAMTRLNRAKYCWRDCLLNLVCGALQNHMANYTFASNNAFRKKKLARKHTTRIKLVMSLCGYCLIRGEDTMPTESMCSLNACLEEDAEFENVLIEFLDYIFGVNGTVLTLNGTKNSVNETKIFRNDLMSNNIYMQLQNTKKDLGKGTYSPEFCAQEAAKGNPADPQWVSGVYFPFLLILDTLLPTFRHVVHSRKKYITSDQVAMLDNNPKLYNQIGVPMVVIQWKPKRVGALPGPGDNGGNNDGGDGGNDKGGDGDNGDSHDTPSDGGCPPPPPATGKQKAAGRKRRQNPGTIEEQIKRADRKMRRASEHLDALKRQQDDDNTSGGEFTTIEKEKERNMKRYSRNLERELNEEARKMAEKRSKKISLVCIDDSDGDETDDTF